MKELNLDFGTNILDTIIQLDDEPDKEANFFEILSLIGGTERTLHKSKAQTHQLSFCYDDGKGFSGGLADDQLLHVMIIRAELNYELTKDSYYLLRAEKFKDLLLIK